MDSSLAYVALVTLVATQRLAEVAWAERNRRRLVAQGAVEFGARHYPMMVALHTAFLISAPLEVIGFDRPFQRALALASLAALIAASALRGWVLVVLGERWTTRVLVVPGLVPVARGPFRFLRHPNYVAVAIEMAALPLVHGAFATAVVFSIANGLLLRHRIAIEERALAWAAGESRGRSSR